MKKVRSKSRPTEIGVIKTFSLSPSDEIGEIAVECTGCTYYYNNLAELCEKWEDYEEPNLAPDQIFLKGSRVCIDYKSIEASRKAVEKLKAWTRLQDKGFRFVGRSIKNLTITYSFDNYDKPDILQMNKDLDLLFGGEE